MSAPPPLDEAPCGRPALLRICSLECRAARRLGLEEARARLVGASDADAAAFARALVRTLPEGLGRRLESPRPEPAAPSFDEAWLLALLAAADRGDRASTAFLLRSRAALRAWSSLTALARGLSRGAAIDIGGGSLSDRGASALPPPEVARAIHPGPRARPERPRGPDRGAPDAADRPQDP